MNYPTGNYYLKDNPKLIVIYIKNKGYFIYYKNHGCYIYVHFTNNDFGTLILIFVANFDILLKYRRVRHHILNRLG